MFRNATIDAGKYHNGAAYPAFTCNKQLYRSQDACMTQTNVVCKIDPYEHMDRQDVRTHKRASIPTSARVHATQHTELTQSEGRNTVACDMARLSQWWVCNICVHKCRPTLIGSHSHSENCAEFIQRLCNNLRSRRMLCVDSGIQSRTTRKMGQSPPEIKLLYRTCKSTMHLFTNVSRQHYETQEVVVPTTSPQTTQRHAQ